MKNMSFNFEHEKFGQLTAIISSGDTVNHTSSIIPATFLIKNKTLDTQSFLFELYGLFAGTNDTMSDIIGEYLVVEDLKLTNEQIVNDINSRYSQLTQKKNAKSSSPIAENDGIDARIISKSNPNEPIYTAQISVNKHNSSLVAHIEEQTTAEKYRKQGLMSKVVTELLPIYCAQNQLSAITLEAGAIDGVDRATLEKIYRGLGFEQKGDLFVRPVELEQSYLLDDNNTYAL